MDGEPACLKDPNDNMKGLLDGGRIVSKNHKIIHVLGMQATLSNFAGWYLILNPVAWLQSCGFGTVFEEILAKVQRPIPPHGKGAILGRDKVVSAATRQPKLLWDTSAGNRLKSDLFSKMVRK